MIRSLALWCVFSSALWLLLSVETAMADDAVNSSLDTALNTPSQTLSLVELLEKVKAERAREKQLNQQREKRFLQEKQKQQERLLQARAAQIKNQKDVAPLKQQVEDNHEEIAQLKQQLALKSQALGDLQIAFKQYSGEVAASLAQSMVSPNFPERHTELTRLAELSSLPSIEDLEGLWLRMQEEMTASAQIQRYQATVVDTKGLSQTLPVVRVGTFTSIGASGFLRYVPETLELLMLEHQPPQRYLNTAQAFFNSSQPLAAMVIDPTQGSLLSLMRYRPSLQGRIQQAGTIGIIIIALGAVGALVACWRIVVLSVISVRVSQQLKQPSVPKRHNPLGRVLGKAYEFKTENEENYQFKLDEAVLAELPKLERGQNFIKLLAAVAPLLGLLGTVTGMILTFQSISLFGNGDPKLMAGGISQALMTTVLGLVVAIPLLFGHSFVVSLSRGVVQRLDEQSAGLLVRRLEQQGADDAG
jgi:biopolymer transport protein ExbB